MPFTNRRCQTLFRVLLVCLVGSLAGCSQSSEQTIVWPDRHDDVGDTGVSGDCFYYPVCTTPSSLVVWQWRGDTIQRACEMQCDKEVTSAATFAPNRWVCHLYAPKHESELCVFDADSERCEYRWKPPHDWHVSLGRGSPIGNRVAVWCQPENYSHEPHNQVRFGMLTADGKSFDWAVTLSSDSSNPAESWKVTDRVVPSNDGKYIGVPGWMGGVLVIDVTQKKPLWVASSHYKPEACEQSGVPWDRIPFEECDATDLAFAPDGKLVYVGGGMGLVYGMKSETGEIVSQWWATLSGTSEAGHRITSVAVSPDGAFVAAGTVPNGMIFLFSAKNGRRCTFKHNRPIAIDHLSFSPDSKRLATYGAGEIKIWKMPEESAK